MIVKFAIGIDLGGTRIKGIAVDAEGNTLHKLYMPTNDGDGAVWKKAVAETVNELLQRINEFAFGKKNCCDRRNYRYWLICGKSICY